MSDFPKFEFSNRDVKRDGEMIAGTWEWNEENAPAVREAFQIANSWRDAHAFPMRSIRCQLTYYLHTLGIEGVTAARLKRMQAIRRKLRRVSWNLSQLQDLGGCRAILPRMADVHRMVEALRDKSRHDLRKEDNYILKPKVDGYRSHHLMFNYRGKGEASIYDGRRIEVQVRTRLQHSWATAVEAIGLFRGEDLKGHQGSEDWLRLFQLMSAEFAAAEGCPPPPGLPEGRDRIREIKALDKRLQAASTLENLNHAVRWTDIAIQSRDTPTFYLIRYDNVSKQVDVEPIYSPLGAVRSYDLAEAKDNKTGRDTENIVLVEAGKIENMKDAYPNYFGDVHLFRQQLRNIVRGKGVEEYVVRPQKTVAPRPYENPDLRWLKRRTRWQ